MTSYTSIDHDIFIHRDALPKATGQSGMIDVGGRRLAFVASSEGLPAVVLETGLGAESVEWAAVQNEVSDIAQVLRYDRIGRGRSDPAVAPRTAHDMVDD